MSTLAAVVLILVIYGAGLIIALAISIYILRRGVEPLRYELARIADVLELHSDAGDDLT